MVFYLRTEGSNGSLFRNGWFQWFSVQELKVPKVPYLEIGVSNVFRSEEHTSELQSRETISYAVFCLKKKKYNRIKIDGHLIIQHK